VDNALKAWAQRRAMKHYGWDVKEFRGRYGKSYIGEKREKKDA
jgi:hypothetical protein